MDDRRLPKSRNIPALAREYGLRESTVRAWIRAGELPAWICSQDPKSKRPRLRVNVADFEAFMRNRRLRVSPAKARQSKRARLGNIQEFV